jgi:predicted phage terminase large subunit-like protein
MEVPVAQLLKFSVSYFTKAVFGYRIGTVHRKILDHIINTKRTLDLAARDHGKSRMLIGYATWLAVNDPNVRILIVSDTDLHAKNVVRTIKTACEHSPIIHQFYGDVKGDIWTDHSLVFTGRDQIFTEPTIMSVGAGSGAATGLHTDHIFVDDIVNFDNARSELQRDRQKDWLKITLMPVLMPHSSMHFFGTRYHYADTYQMVIDKFKFDTQIQRAIQKDGTPLCEWLHPLKDIMEPDGVTVDREGLFSIKETLGPIVFALQYQNDTELMKEGNIFQHKWFRYYDHVEWDEGVLYVATGHIRKRITKIYIGGDPAITTRDTAKASFSAMVVIGQDSDGMMYIIDYVNEHLTFGQQKKRLIVLADKYHPIALNLEDVAYQKALIQELRSEGGMNVIALHPLADKVARANTVTGFFEAHKVHFQAGQTDLTDQLLLFPDGDFDDLVDATVYGLMGFKGGSSVMFVVGVDDD